MLSSFPEPIAALDAVETIRISLVIPAYNEIDSLSPLIDRIRTVMDPLGDPYEIIFVDDGSSDGSLQYLKEQCSLDPAIRVVELRRNFGKSAALSAGFALAEGELVITLDADLQDDPHEIPRMLARLDEGYDLVSGWKAKRNDPLSKTLPSKIANATARLLTGIPVRDMNSGFKCYRREVTRTIQLYGDLHRYIPIMAHYKGFRVTEIPVQHHARKYGKSKYGMSRFMRGMFDLLTVIFINNYRNRPLHLFGGVGLILSLVGFVIDAYLAILWFSGEAIGSRPLLMLGTLLILVGIQFISVGLTAELSVSQNHQREDPLAIVRHVHANHRRA